MRRLLILMSRLIRIFTVYFVDIFFIPMTKLRERNCVNAVDKHFNLGLSVIVLCFVVRYFMSILVSQSSWLVALLNLSSCCLVMVERLFLAVPRGCLRFVIVVFPDHTHYFLSEVVLLIASTGSRGSD